MAFRRRHGSGIRMTGYNYKLIAPLIAREARHRDSGIRVTGYNHNPFRMFTAKRKELFDPLLKKVALAMKRAKRT